MGARFVEDVIAYRRAGYAMLYAVTPEEARVERAIAAALPDVSVLRWSGTEGWADVRTGRVQRDTQDPLAALADVRELPGDGVYLFRDYHFVLDSPGAIRALKDLAPHCRAEGKLVLFISARLVLPPELEKEITLLDVRLPDRDDLGAVLDHILQDAGQGAEVTDRAALIEAAVGMTQAEAENAMALAFVRHKRLNGDAVRTIHREKSQVVRKGGLLEVIEPPDGLDAIGGLDVLKSWLVTRAKAFSPAARAFGLPTPKGVLALGVPGSGKSLAAKCASRAWNLPLLRLDVGRVFAGEMGSSERNMRTAIATAEDMAPCVLWIDEIEKGAAGGSSSGNLDSGTTARVIGSFLTWMQEKTSPVFVFATANRVENLPPELLRKGRFDEIFWVDLPSKDERETIFGIHVSKRGWLTKTNLDLRSLARASEKFTGAEIEQAVIDGLFAAFAADRQPVQRDFLDAVGATVPLAVTRADEIERMRAWAKTRARAASSPEPTVVAPRGRRMEVK